MNYVRVEHTNTIDARESDSYYFIDEIGCKEFDVVMVDTKHGKTLAIVTEVSSEMPILLKPIRKKVLEVISVNCLNEQINKMKIKRLRDAIDARINNIEPNAKYVVYSAVDSTIKALTDEYFKLLQGEGKHD